MSSESSDRRRKRPRSSSSHGSSNQVKKLMTLQQDIKQMESQLVKERGGVDTEQRVNALERELTKRSDETRELETEYRSLLSKLLSSADLKNISIDNAVITMATSMSDQIIQYQSKAKAAREEMASRRDGNDTARKLLNRSRHFEKENAELEKQVNHGVVSWKKAQLAVLNCETTRLERNQQELQEYVLQLDDEVLGMEGKVTELQQLLDERKPGSKPDESGGQTEDRQPDEARPAENDMEPDENNTSQTTTEADEASTTEEKTETEDVIADNTETTEENIQTIDAVDTENMETNEVNTADNGDENAQEGDVSMTTAEES